MDEQTFDAYVEEAYAWLLDRQAELEERYHIGTGHYDDFWYEQHVGYLQFLIEDTVEIEFPIIFIGSWNNQRESYMWSWANEYTIQERRDEGLPLRELADITGKSIFTYESPFDCDEQMAWQLAAMAARHLGAIGVYRAPEGDALEIFLAILSPE